MTYTFKNLNIKYAGKDWLAYGTAEYELDDFGDGDSEAGFLSAKLTDAIGLKGHASKEELTAMEDAVVSSLNQNDSLCRLLGR